jgi:hypothetical protein
MLVSPGSDQFILSAFDRDQRCPVLRTRFRPNTLDAFRSILGEEASGDPKLQHRYLLDGYNLAAVVKRFGVAFDPEPLQCTEPDLLFGDPETEAIVRFQCPLSLRDECHRSLDERPLGFSQQPDFTPKL